MSMRFDTCSLIFLFFIVSLSDERAVAPDIDKISHDIAAGRGLYYNFKQIFELNTNNFKSTVFDVGSTRTWVVEFYNSWCGHCHRFAPIFKSLAVDIYNWRDVVAIGAVDCSNDVNNQLCRDYEIMAYPSLKIFPQGSDNTFLGNTFTKGSAQNMKLDIIKEIIAEDSNGKKRTNLNLQPFNDSDLNILWLGVPLDVQYIFLIIIDQNVTPYLGIEVALDLYPVQSIHVRTAYSDNKGLLLRLPTVSYPTLYVVERNNNRHQFLSHGSSRDSRESMYHAVKEFLAPKGIIVPEKANVSVENLDIDVSKIMERIQMKEELKKKLQSKDLSDVVFQVDLEGALRYSLFKEIRVHKNIEGEKLDALKNYVTILSKYFPIATEGRRFLKSVKDYVLQKNNIDGKNFSDFAKHNEEILNDVFLSQQSWIGCQGSQPQYRGYPCSLWTMFHTLTVQADSRKQFYPNSDPQEVLKAMIGYITNFFGCTDCSQHFQKMAVTMAGNVSSIDDSIIWLWRAHNAANSRLAGDVTEDPEHKKVQFPSRQSCPNCRHENSDEWIIPNVLSFLKSMYTNISYFQWNDLSSSESTTSKSPSEISYSKRLRHDNVGNENGYKVHDALSKSIWDFNVFDISLCVVLYVSSVIILLLVCIKFVMRKSYKKKNSFDMYHIKV